MNKKENTDKVKKIIPSKLETGVEQIIYKTFGKMVPKNMTPNQITLIGGLGGLIGIIFAFLAKFNLLFLIITILGILCHLICDDLDGFIARERKMSSTVGGYLDLLIDILHITYLIIALSFSGIINFKISIFLVPLYAIIIFADMNFILHLNEFLFPKLGPIETHLFFIVICIVSIFLGIEPLLYIWNEGFNFADILCIVGGIIMYFEMIKLQVQLFQRLRLKDENSK